MYDYLHTIYTEDMPNYTEKYLGATAPYISLVGLDGCGKSTQADLLSKEFKDLDYKVLRINEPENETLGQAIRELTLGSLELEPLTEFLLFSANRVETIKKIRKWDYENEGKKIIISDRCFHCSIAYQSTVGYKNLQKINEIVVGGVKPDLSILLDVKYDTLVKRKSDRVGSTIKLDRFSEIRQGYVNQLSENFILLDGDKEQKYVTNDIMIELLNKFKLH